MNEMDPRLRRLLQEWRAIEPRGDFAAQVWQRIRRPAAGRSFADWLWSWIPRPAVVLPVSVAAGLLIGFLSGWFSAAPASSLEQTGFLGPDTLAGRYALISGR